MTQVEDIRLMCGAGTETMGENRADPGEFACVSPVYGRTRKYITPVCLESRTRVFQDSGAFSDSTDQRLSFKDAFERQITHASRYGYADLIEAQASYDVLIDEVWALDKFGQSQRHKRRWSASDAEWAVDQTVAAAQWIDAHRDATPAPHLILSAQGVDAPQYLRCAERVMPYMREGDAFGLGGWCVVGKPQFTTAMMPVLNETMAVVIPFLAREGVKRVHIWGVCYAPALGVLLAACDNVGIDVSTDSAGPMIRPTLGQWGYDNWWRDGLPKTTNRKEANDRMTQHVIETRKWLADFKQRSGYHYRMPRVQDKAEAFEQLSLF